METQTLYADGSVESHTDGPLLTLKELVELGVRIIECADWITPLTLALQGYTVVVYHSMDIDEVCAVFIAWKLEGHDVVMYGNEIMGWCILAKPQK
jgi:hypothetical protein